MPIARPPFRLPSRLDLRSRRTLVALALVPFALALLSLGPDLFYAIPWPIRKRAGQVLFLAALGAGLARLLTVRPEDTWPAPDDDDATAGGRTWRWLPWALQLAVASLALPLLRSPDALGFGDWDHHLMKFEAIRRIILEWHQFPWWTPWCRGGFPLASEPECGVVSIATPLVLAFGAGVGLRLATVACLMVAVEGARRLAMLWVREPWGAAAAGLIYGLNGAALVYTVAGHFIPMSYCATPWMMYYAFRIGRQLSDGLALGFWTAFDVLNGIQYPSVYGFLLTLLVGIRALRVQPAPLRGRLVVNTLAGFGVFLALAGWRLATTGLVLRDYPREWASLFDDSPWNAFRWLLLRPGTDILETVTSTYFWESARYVGPLVVLLAAASLRLGWRWWHTLTLACFWLALGSVKWYHPSYWLSQGPVFGTMHVVTRWRIPAMLGLGLSAASILAYLRTRPALPLRMLAVAAVLVLAADFLSYGHQILPVSCRVAPSEDRFPGPPTSSLVNVQHGPDFAAIRRGYGVVRAQEPLLGYDKNLPTARLWKGHPDYIGEAWSEGRPLAPESWSPGRIVFQTRPGQEVHINQNPGSWWLVNDQPIFADWRCAEWNKPFAARADSRGRLELRIVPRGLVFGLRLHALGLALVAATVGWTFFRRRGEPLQGN